MNPIKYAQYQIDIGLLRDNDDLVMVSGCNPIFISSVHAKPHERQGKIKPLDRGSFEFSYMLAKYLNASCIINNISNVADSNYYPNTEFKKTLISHVKSLSQLPKIWIDVHTSHAARYLDLEIGSMHGKSLLDRTEYVNLIISSINKFGFLVDHDRHFTGQLHSGDTMCKFASEVLNVPTLQLEISSAILATDDLMGLHLRSKLMEAIRQFMETINSPLYESWPESHN